MQCTKCDHVFNANFDSSVTNYDIDYENSLHHSVAFQAYLEQSIQELITRLDLKGNTILEIGCGQGEFLKMLCAKTGSRGTGYDPSFRTDRKTENNIKIYTKRFDAASIYEKYDVVVFRHLLEHIDDPVLFIKHVRSVLSDSVFNSIIIEVPNGDYVWRHGSLWDVLHDHVSYFSKMSMHSLFRISGIPVLFIEERFGRQYLLAASQSDRGACSNAAYDGTHYESNKEDVEIFSRNFPRLITYWRKYLADAQTEGKRTCLWGAGTKAITFLNYVVSSEKALMRSIENVVDINPHKHGRYIPGTAHAIVAPSTVLDDPPDLVLVMNPNYVDEIEATLKRHLQNYDRCPQIVSVLGEPAALGTP